MRQCGGAATVRARADPGRVAHEPQLPGRLRQAQLHHERPHDRLSEHRRPADGDPRHQRHVHGHVVERPRPAAHVTGIRRLRVTVHAQRAAPHAAPHDDHLVAPRHDAPDLVGVVGVAGDVGGAPPRPAALDVVALLDLAVEIGERIGGLAAGSPLGAAHAAQPVGERGDRHQRAERGEPERGGRSRQLPEHDRADDRHDRRGDGEPGARGCRRGGRQAKRLVEVIVHAPQSSRHSAGGAAPFPHRWRDRVIPRLGRRRCRPPRRRCGARSAR